VGEIGIYFILGHQSDCAYLLTVKTKDNILTSFQCLSNWQVGSSLVAVGLSVWQAMIATIIGKLIISAVAISNGYVGAEWHIGFPVYARVIWGMYDSYLALVQRILLGLVWFSVQSWTGGLCITAVLGAMFPSFI
jgi:NCS1 family nucleobase:cation symporter-1